MVEIRRNLVNPNKYNIKCPYEMTPEFIVVHNTANDASAANEVQYMINNNNQVSFHYAVDDKEIVQGIPTNRNTWNAGDGSNGKGNRKGLSIEICYSKSGGDRFTTSERNAAEFIASLLKAKGWGIDRVKKHQDFNGKYCPHRTLDMGWDRFLNIIKEYMGESTPTYTYEEFVRDVQRTCGARVDGIAGPETLSKTVTISARKNSTHAVVKPVQKYLITLGYNCGSYGADGIFGNATTTAVKKYQVNNGCVSDGEITAKNKTWKKLLKLA